MRCPYCEKEHNIFEKIEQTKMIFKGEEITFENHYYECEEKGIRFFGGKTGDQNLMRARDAYRKKMGLLTSSEIASIRNKYNLTQKDYSFIFGWGEVTVTRYESNSIQDVTYDELMRRSNEDPYFLLEMLEKNKSNFCDAKYSELRKKIEEKIDRPVLMENLFDRALEIEYSSIDENSIYCGYKKIEKRKIESIIKYIAENISFLTKTKLAKLLWYIDMYNFKKRNISMTGLAYIHMPYGAYPVGYEIIMLMPSMKIEEIENKNCTINRIITCESNLELGAEEIEIIDKVILDYGDMKTKEIVDYMHLEKAYVNTQKNELISYEFAKDIK
ncbi:MAG: DUF4065 domain-containing protein [Candidatus Izemoplasmatales bacterium]|nr:DUF4065 domain-containing protein [Candidatus Izemoplasmatales bacterium]